MTFNVFNTSLKKAIQLEFRYFRFLIVMWNSKNGNLFFPWRLFINKKWNKSIFLINDPPLKNHFSKCPGRLPKCIYSISSGKFHLLLHFFVLNSIKCSLWYKRIWILRANIDLWHECVMRLNQHTLQVMCLAREQATLYMGETAVVGND